jgi:hypothetical protein
LRIIIHCHRHSSRRKAGMADLGKQRRQALLRLATHSAS